MLVFCLINGGIKAMKKIKINEKTSDSFLSSILQFIIKYGDNHITKQAIKWLKNTSTKEINSQKGNIIHVIVNDQKKIIGIIAVANYGLEQAIIVVDPKVRKSGIGYRLTKGVLEDIDRYYVKVAHDNIPSLKLCFSVGMQAFDLIKGPTGKPTLILGAGDYDPQEWHSRKK